MKGIGWFDHNAMATRVVVFEHNNDGSRTVHHMHDSGDFWTTSRVPEGVEGPTTLIVPQHYASALRDGLVQALGAPSQDERIAALEAEVRVLREWLAAERGEQ